MHALIINGNAWIFLFSQIVSTSTVLRMSINSCFFALLMPTVGGSLMSAHITLLVPMINAHSHSFVVCSVIANYPLDHPNFSSSIFGEPISICCKCIYIHIFHICWFNEHAHYNSSCCWADGQLSSWIQFIWIVTNYAKKSFMRFIYSTLHCHKYEQLPFILQILAALHYCIKY